MTNDISVVDADEVVEAMAGRRNQRGMVSAEWAVGIIAAVAIAGVLLGIVTSGPVRRVARFHLDGDPLVL